MSFSRGTRSSLTALVLALPYVPFLLGARPGGWVGAVLLGLAAMAAPGWVGVVAGKGTGAPRKLVAALLAAALLNVAAAVVLKVLSVPPEPRSFAAALGGLTVIGGAILAHRRPAFPFTCSPVVAGVAMAAFGLAAAAGAPRRAAPRGPGLGGPGNRVRARARSGAPLPHEPEHDLLLRASVAAPRAERLDAHAVR